MVIRAFFVFFFFSSGPPAMGETGQGPDQQQENRARAEDHYGHRGGVHLDVRGKSPITDPDYYKEKGERLEGEIKQLEQNIASKEARVANLRRTCYSNDAVDCASLISGLEKEIAELKKEKAEKTAELQRARHNQATTERTAEATTHAKKVQAEAEASAKKRANSQKNLLYVTSAISAGTGAYLLKKGCNGMSNWGCVPGGLALAQAGMNLMRGNEMGGTEGDFSVDFCQTNPNLCDNPGSICETHPEHCEFEPPKGFCDTQPQHEICTEPGEFCEKNPDHELCGNVIPPNPRELCEEYPELEICKTPSGEGGPDCDKYPDLCKIEPPEKPNEPTVFKGECPEGVGKSGDNCTYEVSTLSSGQAPKVTVTPLGGTPWVAPIPPEGSFSVNDPNIQNALKTVKGKQGPLYKEAATLASELGAGAGGMDMGSGEGDFDGGVGGVGGVFGKEGPSFASSFAGGRGGPGGVEDIEDDPGEDDDEEDDGGRRSPYKNLLSQFNRKKNLKRDLVGEKAVTFGEDKIGVMEDNIFLMVNRTYEKHRRHDEFIEESRKKPKIKLPQRRKI